MPSSTDFLTGSSGSGNGIPSRWKALQRYAVGSGTWVSPIDGYVRIHCQGPGGAGRRAPIATLGGPGGGAGGRAIKTIKVKAGDSFPWTISAGGATEGANGAGTTTIAGMVGNPGSGATAGLTGTSFNTGGGPGGTATGGDINLTGGRGGNTDTLVAAVQNRAHAASGGGAPYTNRLGVFPGLFGLPGQSLTTSTNYPRFGQHRGGGRGGYFISVEMPPLPGARGGGGGGGSGAATNTPTPSNYFAPGGSGEVLIEIEDTSIRQPQLNFDGYKSHVHTQLWPRSGTILTSSGMPIPQNRIALAYVEIEEDVLVEAICGYFTETGGYGNAYVKFGLYDADTKLLVTQSGNITVPVSNQTYAEAALAVDFIKKGSYYIGIAYNGSNAALNVKSYKSYADSEANNGYTVYDEFSLKFPGHPPSSIPNGTVYTRNILGYDFSQMAQGAIVFPTEMPSHTDEIVNTGLPALMLKAR